MNILKGINDLMDKWLMNYKISVDLCSCHYSSILSNSIIFKIEEKNVWKFLV
jgi:hypothetical protein